MTKLSLVEWLRKGCVTFSLNIEENYTVSLANGESLKSIALLNELGDRNGMLIFESFGLIRHHLDELHRRGFGYSVMEARLENYVFFPEEFIDVIRDWGWSSSERPMPDWLK